jgi:hypothetical protein
MQFLLEKRRGKKFDTPNFFRDEHLKAKRANMAEENAS